MTLWTEHPYGGYDSLNYEKLREWWELHAGDVNGVLIPGFWTAKIRPFELIDDMEQAVRNEGVMWIYQGPTPFKLADESSYQAAYRLVNKYIFFNRSKASPLPVVSLYPMMEARPYGGPNATTILLEAHHLSDVIADKVAIFSETRDLTYIGVNLSEKELITPNITIDDAPCLIAEIPWNDLLLSQAKGMILELELLIRYARWLDLNLSTSKALEAGRKHTRNGEYEMAASSLEPAIQRSYTTMFEDVVPLVDDVPPEIPPPPPVPRSRSGLV